MAQIACLRSNKFRDNNTGMHLLKSVPWQWILTQLYIPVHTCMHVNRIWEKREDLIVIQISSDGITRYAFHPEHLPRSLSRWLQTKRWTKYYHKAFLCIELSTASLKFLGRSRNRKSTGRIHQNLLDRNQSTFERQRPSFKWKKSSEVNDLIHFFKSSLFFGDGRRCLLDPYWWGTIGEDLHC